MRFRVPGITGDRAVEVDAWTLLGLLVTLEPDPSATWTSHLAQHLSANLLLGETRGYYLASRDTPGEPPDHSNLHLVELLLDASRRGATDPDPIKQHFLAVELSRRQFDPADGTLVIAHYVESLGLLLADARLRWSAAERQQVRDWLGWVEAEPFRDLASVDPPRLTHLLRGLRLIRKNRQRLD